MEFAASQAHLDRRPMRAHFAPMPPRFRQALPVPALIADEHVGLHSPRAVCCHILREDSRLTPVLRLWRDCQRAFRPRVILRSTCAETTATLARDSALPWLKTKRRGARRRSLPRQRMRRRRSSSAPTMCRQSPSQRRSRNRRPTKSPSRLATDAGAAVAPR